jgi:hypothetical protein
VTDPNGSAGQSDLFVYDLNVRVAYFIEGGQLHLTVLGCDKVAVTHPASDIRNPALSGVDAQVAARLVALDPNLGGPLPSLPTTRFLKLAQGIDGSSVPTKTYRGFIVSETEEDTSSVVQQSTVVTDTKPGWLVALFSGDTETTTTVTLTSTSTLDDKSSTTLMEQIYYQTLPLPPGATSADLEYRVDVYYDKLFQSFLCVPPGTYQISEAIPSPGRPPV